MPFEAHMPDASDELVTAFCGKRVLILGDVMLDRYIYGRVSRISPEAPVPVLAIENEAAMPGGSGNVACNVVSLGGEAVVIGLTGDDLAGDQLQIALKRVSGVIPVLVRSASRRTTCKTRYVCGHQQILRADSEDAILTEESATLIDAFYSHLDAADVVVLSDYAKGALRNDVIAAVLAGAQEAGKPVIVDPKGHDFTRYDGADILTPNRVEAALATGLDGIGDEEVAAAAEAILAALPRSHAVLITRGARGMTLKQRGTSAQTISGRRCEVFDVSGAGDTVVAALALSVATGVDLSVAAEVANIAAGIAVTKVGTVAVSAETLRREMRTQQVQECEAKIVSREEAMAQAARWRAQGARIGFTNGCFDLMHPGHVSLLAQARASCDRLIVGLNTDISVKRLKGASRPIQNETARAVVLASLAAVDLVVLFAEQTPQALIEALCPDLLVKGADYRGKKIAGADFVVAHGGSVKLADLVEGYSSSAMIDRLSVNAENAESPESGQA